MTDPPEAPDNMEQQEAREQRFWTAADRIRERNAGKNPDDELTFITTVVEEVRQKCYDTVKSKVTGCH